MDHKVTQVMEQCGCDAATAMKYLELIAQGYSEETAQRMAGLIEPDEEI